MNPAPSLTPTMTGVAATHNAPDSVTQPDSSRADKQSLKSAALEFETLLITQMLKSMRAATESMTDGDSESSNRSTTLYTEQLDAEMAKVMASRGGFGIHEMLVRQLGGEAVDQINQGPG